MKSLYNLSALRKIDLNEDKLKLECLLSNLKIKGNLGLDNEDIYKTKYLDYFIPELRKKEFLLYQWLNFRVYATCAFLAKNRVGK